MTGRVFAVEEFSLYDGPGIRTTVFLKGCPLRCSWCHNPEGQAFEKQVVKSPNGCLHCGRCVAEAMRTTGRETLVPACIPVCPKGLLREAGTDVTPEELVEKIVANKAFFDATGGGVTFSGGEPLAQGAFLVRCLTLICGRVHTLVQTAGYAAADVFDEVLSAADGFLFDLKLLDGADFARYCGGDLAVVMRNFEALCASGVSFTVRVPLIPGVTDTAENLGGLAALLEAHGVTNAELMPYNPLAGAKYALCARKFEPDFDPTVPFEARTEIFEAHGVRVKVL